MMSGGREREEPRPNARKVGRSESEQSESEQSESEQPESEQSGGVVDRADYDPDYDPAQPVDCEVCGGSMDYTASCKLRCSRCGYMRDCSDP